MTVIYDVLPKEYDSQKAGLIVQSKIKDLNISGDYFLRDNVIKAERMTFDPNSRLIVDNLDLPWVAIYADIWSFFGPAEIMRRDLNLDGANGAQVTPIKKTFPEPGRSGIDGFDGMAGRDAHDTPKIPSIYIFSQQMLINGRPALPSDVNLNFMLDGLQGGNGGNGSDGTDGTDGGKGEPSISGPFFCSEGPGRGGRGGNAGRGGQPGYGGNGGDAPSLTFFLSPDCERAFTASKYSLQGGRPGRDGRPGKAGNIGLGGDEGEPIGNCFKANRKGDNGQVPKPCPHPIFEHHDGLGNNRVIMLYTGFDELGS